MVSWPGHRTELVGGCCDKHLKITGSRKEGQLVLLVVDPVDKDRLLEHSRNKNQLQRWEVWTSTV